MKSRIAIAAALIPFVYLATILRWENGLLFALVVSIAVTIAVLELYVMFRPHRPYVPAGMFAVALAPILAWLAGEPGIFAAMLTVLPLTMTFAQLSDDNRDQAASITATLTGVFYIAIPAGLAVIVHSSPDGSGYIILMLAGIWVNDSAAYFVGRAIGRTKLAPRLSPKKSVEGLVAGMAAGTFVVWYGHFLFNKGIMTGGEAFILGLAIAVATPFGDLFESMVKRAVKIKDSGHLLGEHGGMLDRLDAILVAAPVTYLVLFALGKL